MPPPASAHNHNLPAPVSSFVGRALELRAIEQRLRESRLLTLTGPGGTGKTRLALEAARAELERFPDGVWLVELAGLPAPDLVVDAISAALDLPPSAAQPPLERLGGFLHGRRLLLLLDNCEHLLAECAHVAAFLLARCPQLTLLATSREPLMIGGEAIVRVPPLSLPDPRRPLRAAGALEADAMRLFVDRASAAEPAFQLTALNTPAVAEICVRLDGMPLALELAAAHVRGMDVGALAARLDQRFRLLVGGDRSALPRQQTLYSAIDWSYRLLSGVEQAVARQLAIFAGDFSLEAAEYVCGADHATAGLLGHLLRLVDKSLVQFNQASGRYRLLESIRVFGLERLAEAGDTHVLGARHFDWYLALAEDAAPRLSGPQQAAVGRRVEAEHDNIRAALSRALEAGRVEDAARLALLMWRFWHTRTYQREGLRTLEHILERDATSPLPAALRPRLFSALGVLSNSVSRFEQAAAYHSEALRLWRALGDSAGEAQALCDIGMRHFDEMHQAQALAYAAASLALATAAGDRPAVARARYLGALATIEGDPYAQLPAEPAGLDAAIAELEQCLAIWRDLGDSSNMALAMSLLARGEDRRGNHRRAGPLLREAVRLLAEAGNFIDLQGPLVALLNMASDGPRQPEGVRLSAQVAGLMTARFEKLGFTSPWHAGPFQQNIERMVEMLGVEAFEQAFEQGKRVTPDGLIELSEKITSLAAQPAPPHAGLTDRELEVLRLVAGGLTNAEVGRRLHVTPRTVNAHLTAIYSKLGVASRGGAMRYAFEHRLT